jgi:flagellar biosynthesis protein FlhB
VSGGLIVHSEELYVAVMAGFVLAFFLMAGEIAALRKQIQKIYAHFRKLYDDEQRFRLLIEVIGVTILLLLQPLIIALLVVFALDQFNAGFSHNAWHQLHHLLTGVILSDGWVLLVP